MIRSIAPVDEHARSAPATEPRDRSVTVTPWLVVLFAAALALRLVGITYGLPTVFHPDEPTSINEATALLHGGQDALTFANPPLYKYMLVAVFAVLGPVTQLDRSSLFVIARAVSALFGALTILPTYAIGRMVRDRQTGLVAAVLASATLLQVRESHFGVNDALATFCSTLALAAIVRIACRGSRRDYVLAGAGVGLAFAAKYQCAAVLIPLLLAHASNHWRARTAARHDGTSAPGLRWRRTLRWDAHQDLLIALGVAGLTAVVAFPPLVTESRRVVADVYVFLMLPSRLGFEGLDPSGAYPFYVNSLGWDVGWPILLLAAIASAFAVARRDWAVLVVASLPVALYVVMGSSKMYVARFMLPGVPALAVLAAIAIRALALAARARALSDASTPWSAQLIGIAAARPSFDVAAFVTAALTAAALVGTLPASLQFDALLTRPDTRTQALDWLAANLPANATVLTDPSPFGPSLDKLPVHVVLPPPGQAVYDQSVESYRAQGIQYIVSSSFISDAPALDAARNARRLEFYGRLDASAQTLAEFDPARSASLPFVYDRIYGPLDSLDHIEYPGPRLKIYRL